MKTLLFSDTHLTKSFEKDKFFFLKKIISQSDRVIILGDFWDSSLVTFDEFINSNWNMLFPLLKEKHTIYIYGNHDKKEFSDKRVSLFSTKQGERYKFRLGKRIFIAEHGDSMFKKHLAYQLTYGGSLKRFFMSRPFITVHFLVIEKYLVKFFGFRFVRTRLRFNNYAKRANRPRFKKNMFIISGHTHSAEVDYTQNFINTGMIRHGIAQYILINEKEIILNEKWYKK